MIEIIFVCLICCSINKVDSQNVIASQRNMKTKKGDDIILKWILIKGKVFNVINNIEVYRGHEKNDNLQLFDGRSNPLNLVENAPKQFFKRLSANIVGNVKKGGDDVKYTMNLTKAQYGDSGSFLLEVAFWNEARNLVPIVKNATITLQVNDPPEHIRNIITESKLTYTLKGVPSPKVTWGFMKNETKTIIQPRPHTDRFYINDYLLKIETNMCGKVIYFSAVGYKNQLNWNVKPKFKCVSPSRETIFTAPGTNVTFIWTVYKASKDEAIKSLRVYRGITERNASNLLLENDEFPTKYSKEIFDERLLHAKIENNEELKTTYIARLLNIQYNDGGYFNFEAIFSNKVGATVSANATIELLLPDPINNEKNLSTFPYIGGAVGLVVLIIAIVITVVLVKRKRRIARKKKSREQPPRKNIPIVHLQMKGLPIYEEVKDTKPNDKKYYENMRSADIQHTPGYLKPVNIEYLELLDDN